MPKFIHESLEEKKFLQLIAGLEDNWEYALDRALLDITEQIVREMEKRNMNKVTLAEKLGVSRAYITQLLKGKPNLQLNTLFKIAFALKLRPKINLERQESPYQAKEWGLVRQTQYVPLGSIVKTYTIQMRPITKEYEPATQS